MVFDYPAKGGARRVKAIADDDTAAILRALKRRRGGRDRLLAYRLGRRWHELGADELNEYLKHHLGGGFSAKDFRTWNATVLAALALAGADTNGASRRSREQAIRGSVREVAHYLGNTPTVCRTAYIDPRVFDRFRAGTTIAGALNGTAPDPFEADRQTRQRIEASVVAMLGDGSGA